MPNIITDVDNSFIDGLGQLAMIPLQLQQQKQAKRARGLEEYRIQSQIERNNAATAKDRQALEFSQQQQAAFNSPDIGLAMQSLFTPDETGSINPTNLDALLKFNPSNTLSNIGDLMQDLSQIQPRQQVAAMQDVKTATGRANLAALAANKALPTPYSTNAKGVTTNEITGATSAPNKSVLDALIAQGASDGGNDVIGQAMITNLVKSPALDDLGDPVTDLNGAPVMRVDNNKVQMLAELASLPENKGLSDDQLVAKFAQLLEAQKVPSATEIAKSQPIDQSSLFDRLMGVITGPSKEAKANQENDPLGIR